MAQCYFAVLSHMRFSLVLATIVVSAACSPGFHVEGLSPESSEIGQTIIDRPPDVYAPNVNGQKICVSTPTPGRTTLHRLNRIEYNNTLRDLLGIQSKPGDRFPVETGANFLNNADSLSMNSSLLDLVIEISGSSIDEAFAANKSRFMICTQSNSACATQILTAFAERAFRRPVTAAEVSRLATFVSVATGQGQTFEAGIKLAMRATISSPDFLYRGIKNPAPDNPASVVELDSYELASRLSYFIWSSMPDNTLFALAKNGTLKQPEILSQQVTRMLQDPKAAALVESLGMPWLGLSLFDQIEPDSVNFPELTDSLKQNMLGESQAFFRDLITTNQSFSTLVTADYSFLNKSMADHYGIAGVTGANFSKVTLPNSDGRRGILGHASILAVTSHASETSIVRRGLFVAQNLICDAPPPPPEVPPLPPDLTPLEASNLLVSSPACMGCHNKMNPLGYALEEFNPIGKRRMNYRDGTPINAKGQFPDGVSFDGASELGVAVAKSERFPLCVATKVLSYSLGRELNTADDCAVSQLSQEVGELKTVSQLFQAIVLSETFRKQAGEGATP